MDGRTEAGNHQVISVTPSSLKGLYYLNISADFTLMFQVFQFTYFEKMYMYVQEIQSFNGYTHAKLTTRMLTASFECQLKKIGYMKEAWVWD